MSSALNDHANSSLNASAIKKSWLIWVEKYGILLWTNRLRMEKHSAIRWKVCFYVVAKALTIFISTSGHWMLKWVLFVCFNNDAYTHARILYHFCMKGYEMVILRNIDFSKIDIRLILVEDAWIPSRELDQHLTNHGFIKYQHMTIDSVFINRRHLKDVSTHTWYPEYFYKWTSDENMFRATKDDYRKKLKCS